MVNLAEKLKEFNQENKEAITNRNGRVLLVDGL